MKPGHIIVLVAALFTLIAFLAVDSDSSNRAVYFGLIGAILITSLIAFFAALARSSEQDETRRAYFAMISTLIGFIAGIAGGTVAGSAAGNAAGDTAASDVTSELEQSLDDIQSGVEDVQTDVNDVQTDVEDVRGTVDDLQEQP